jgi:hypothetical protein
MLVDGIMLLHEQILRGEYKSGRPPMGDTSQEAVVAH